MKILIVGGGVAGPAFAGFLKSEKNIDITLIDKAPEWGDIGYAISLWGNGRNILEKLGVEKTVRKEGYEIPWSVFEDEEGDVLKQFTFKIFRPYGATLVVTRSTLHNALIETIGRNTNVKLSTTLTRIDQKTNGVHVTLSDGDTEVFDLVVGADGIHSQVRELVFGKDYLKYYGWKVWTFWTPSGLGHPRGAVELASGGKVYIVYPMTDRAVVVLTAAVPPDSYKHTAKNRDTLHKLFADFKPSVSHMIDAIEDPTEIFCDDLAYVEMKKWYKNRVALVGDAQHATSPITGMGASMALEDAYVLADEIKKMDPEKQLSEVLDRYVKRRDDRVRRFRNATYFIEKWMMVESPLISKLRNWAVRFIPGSYFTDPIEKLLQEEI